MPAPLVVVGKNLYDNSLALYLPIAVASVKGRWSRERPRFASRRRDIRVISFTEPEVGTSNQRRNQYQIFHFPRTTSFLLKRSLICPCRITIERSRIAAAGRGASAGVIG